MERRIETQRDSLPRNEDACTEPMPKVLGKLRSTDKGHDLEGEIVQCCFKGIETGRDLGCKHP